MTEPYAAPPNPAVPPASTNPQITDLARKIAEAMVPYMTAIISGVLSGMGPIMVPPPAPPPPPPAPGPMASMDAANLGTTV